MSRNSATPARRVRRRDILRHYARGSLAMAGGFAAAAVLLALIA